MNKTLYIIRGHQGSGKTTLARKMLHSLEECVHLENDMFLFEHGEYKWSPERLKQAKETLWVRFSNALTNRVKNIIVSNVFSNPYEVRKFTL